MASRAEADLSTVEQEMPGADTVGAVFVLEVIEGPNRGERFTISPDVPGPVLLGQAPARSSYRSATATPTATGGFRSAGHASASTVLSSSSARNPSAAGRRSPALTTLRSGWAAWWGVAARPARPQGWPRPTARGEMLASRREEREA